MLRLQYDAVAQVIGVESALTALPSVLPGVQHYALNLNPSTTGDTDAPQQQGCSILDPGCVPDDDTVVLAEDVVPPIDPDAPSGTVDPLLPTREEVANWWNGLAEFPNQDIQFIYGAADTVIVDTVEGVVVISRFGWSYVFDGGETRAQTHEALRETGDHLFNHLAAAYVGEIEQLVFSNPANNCDADPMGCILLVQELARQQANQVKRETGEAAWAATQATWEECRADGWECSGRSTGVIIDFILGFKGAKRLLGLTDEAAGAGGVVAVLDDVVPPGGRFPSRAGLPTGANQCLPYFVEEIPDLVDGGLLSYGDEALEELLGPLWRQSLDYTFGRMTQAQLEFWSRMSNKYGMSIAVPGGFSETRFGALFRQHLWEEFSDYQGKILMERVGGEYLPTALGLDLQIKIKERYGIDFPAWRFTGKPRSNLPGDLADIDVYMQNGQPVPNGLEEDVREFFGENLEPPKNPGDPWVDDYAEYWDEIPPGSVIFFPDGTIYRKPSGWDSFESLSPDGQQVFEEWLSNWVNRQQNLP